LGGEQLIYSQWAYGRKVLAGEGLTEVSDEKNLFCDLFWWTGMRVIRRADEFFDHTGSVRRPLLNV
jgi:hypothetical protein